MSITEREAMTLTQALKEARRRWGPTASVGADVKRKHYYVFGACSEKEGPEDPLKGMGKSWEGAFMNADRIEKSGKP
jgi:hypothetical protein